MVKSGRNQRAGQSLADIRGDIDIVDDAMLQNLIARAELIEIVKAVKARAGGAGADAMRPGREKQVIARLIERSGGKVPARLILQIWRELIGWATQAQAPMTVHVGVGRGDFSLWNEIRDHFGTQTAIKRHDTGRAALAGLDAARGDAAVMPAQPGKGDAWLGAVLSDAAQGPKVSGCVPLIGAYPAGYIFTAMAREETGDDRTLIALLGPPQQARREVEKMIEQAGLKPVSVIEHERVPESGRTQWLADCAGFYTHESIELDRLGKMPKLYQAKHIGGYPAPIELGDDQ